MLSFSFNAFSEDGEFAIKGQLSLASFYSELDTKWRGGSTLRYIPELSFEKELNSSAVFIFDTSINMYASENSHLDEKSSRNKAELYRFKAQGKFTNSDLRVGLQKLNFGPAIVLRSLQWFDQLNTTDPLGLTDGVWAIRYRYFFENNINFWLWSLYGNEDLKGIEVSETVEGSAEFGGRLEYPLEIGELAFTFHQRKSEKMGFAGLDLEEELMEKRYAFDGHIDIEIGTWFEVVSVDQATSIDNNWYNSFVVGADYTFNLKSGLHVVFEHLHSGFAKTALNINRANNTSALQLNYPLNLIDSFSFLQNLSVNYNLAVSNKYFDGVDSTYITQNNLRISGGTVNLSSKWKITIGGVGYDFVRKSFTYPDFRFQRDLHCWEMGMSWQPQRGTYSFYIRVKQPSQLDFLNLLSI